MLKKCKHDLSSQTRQHTEKVTKCKKNTKEKSEYVTVSKQFKTSEFQNGMFLKPSSDYRSRGGGGTPIHYLSGYVPPNGVVILKLLI